MIRHYGTYRACLLERIPPEESDANVASALDLMHLRYLLESIRGPGLKAAIRAHLEGAPRSEIVAHAFAASAHPLAALPGFPSSRLWRSYFALRAMAAPARRMANRSISGLQRLTGGTSRLRSERGGILIELNPPVPEQIRARAPQAVDGAIDAIFEALLAYAAAAPDAG
jgi:hypothetical protein